MSDATPSSPTSPSTALLNLVEQVGSMATASGRTDLVERLLNTRNRLHDPNVRVVVVGEFKQGKSKLINALVNAPACPIDDDVATSVPTSVGYGDEPAAFVFRRDETAEGGRDAVVREPIALESLADYVSESGNPGNEKELVGAEVLLPREILRGGLRLIDSPGVGSLDSASALATLSALSSAHAVLLVSDASQEYTEPEVQLLRRAMRLSPNVAAVLAKTDLYPDWRDIAGIDRGHLADIGELPLFPVSSDLRLLAATEQDRELNNESGFPALVAHLRADVLQRAETIVARSALHDISFVVEQMTVSARSELSALENPEGTPRLIAELEEAKERADDFRGRSSRWQIALADGVADLIADMEHDLRDRLRRVQREAEQAIDEGDPGPIWDQLAGASGDTPGAGAGRPVWPGSAGSARRSASGLPGATGCSSVGSAGAVDRATARIRSSRKATPVGAAATSRLGVPSGPRAAPTLGRPTSVLATSTMATRIAVLTPATAAQRTQKGRCPAERRGRPGSAAGGASSGSSVTGVGESAASPASAAPRATAEPGWAPGATWRSNDSDRHCMARGIRADPPTMTTVATGSSTASSVAWRVATLRASVGSTSCSNSARVRRTDVSWPGSRTGMVARESADSSSLASTHSPRSSAHASASAAGSSGTSAGAAAGASVGRQSRTWRTTMSSKSMPPRSARVVESPTSANPSAILRTTAQRRPRQPRS